MEENVVFIKKERGRGRGELAFVRPDEPNGDRTGGGGSSSLRDWLQLRLPPQTAVGLVLGGLPGRRTELPVCVYLA